MAASSETAKSPTRLGLLVAWHDLHSPDFARIGVLPSADAGDGKAWKRRLGYALSIEHCAVLQELEIEIIEAVLFSLLWKVTFFYREVMKKKLCLNIFFGTRIFDIYYAVVGKMHIED